MDAGNYRNRILVPLAKKLGWPKLNFQLLRSTMATLAQKKVRSGYPGVFAARQG